MLAFSKYIKNYNFKRPNNIFSNSSFRMQNASSVLQNVSNFSKLELLSLISNIHAAHTTFIWQFIFSKSYEF